MFRTRTTRDYLCDTCPIEIRDVDSDEELDEHGWTIVRGHYGPGVDAHYCPKHKAIEGDL